MSSSKKRWGHENETNDDRKRGRSICAYAEDRGSKNNHKRSIPCVGNLVQASAPAMATLSSVHDKKWIFWPKVPHSGN